MEGEGNELENLEAEQDVPLDELIARYMKKRDQLTEGEEASTTTSTGSSELDEEEEEEDDTDGEEADDEPSTALSSAKEIDEELGNFLQFSLFCDSE